MGVRRVAWWTPMGDDKAATFAVLRRVAAASQASTEDGANGTESIAEASWSATIAVSSKKSTAGCLFPLFLKLD